MFRSLRGKKNAEIVDLSGLVINNIRWGYNGGEWLPAEELNVETAEGLRVLWLCILI